MPIDEIIVTGKRDRRPPPTLPGGSVGGAGRLRTRTRGGSRAFIPPVLPVPIEEIIVRAPASRPPVAAPSSAGAAGAGLLWATLGGMFIAEMLREFSQRKLDEAFDFWTTGLPPRPKASPLEIAPGPGPSVVDFTYPELPPTLPPLPEIPPLWDPMPELAPEFVKPPPASPALPTFQPSPNELPDWKFPEPRPPPRNPVILFPFDPTLPGVGSPFRTPVADPVPGLRGAPETRPAPSQRPQPTTRPIGDPFAFPAPNARPGPGIDPRFLTPTQPGGVRSPDTVAFPEFAIDPKVPMQTSECPPCKAEKDDPREQCYRKLVKESRFPENDTVYNWVEINCDTGREIKPEEF